MRRDTLTTDPREGDYILSPTGFSWNVLRSIGCHRVQSISVGDRDKRTALARLLSLAETDKAGGWETAGTGIFWQIAFPRSVSTRPL